MRGIARDLQGRRFGWLVAQGRVGYYRDGSVLWCCACDCGGTKDVPAMALVGGRVKSCGCLRKQVRVPTTDALFSRSTPEPNTGCWLWAGATTARGYGRLIVGRIPILAHRLMYELVVGPPGALFVCHRCDTPACVNPAHLFIGTHADNMADMQRKGRAIGNPRLAAATVREVREACASGETQASIASRFGIGEATVSRIHTRTAWRDLQ